jgi:RNase P/RNase MRP subunit p30
MKIIKEDNFENARNKIKKLKKETPEEEVIFTSNKDDLNRKILEKTKINILLINQKNKRDFHKQRNSGFNQVLSRETKNKKIKIGINLDEILEEKNILKKAKILARIKQNIILCNKNRIKMKFILQKRQNKRNQKNLKSLGLVLGMPTWMTRDL